MGAIFSSLNKVEQIKLIETSKKDDDDKVTVIVELTDEESERLLYFAFRPTVKQLLIRR